MTGFARDLPFGATLIAPEVTRFRLWAPGQQEVAVEIDGNARVAMTRDAGGWFEAEAACGAGASYRYRLGTGLAVPDPASRAQADDVHGPSLVVDPRAYRWQHPAWRGLQRSCGIICLLTFSAAVARGSSERVSASRRTSRSRVIPRRQAARSSPSRTTRSATGSSCG